MLSFSWSVASEADRVVMVCSDNYLGRANAREGGVGYEGLIVTAELAANIGTKKFIPLIRNSVDRKVPTFLGPRYYLDFSADEEYETRLEELLQEIHQTLTKPPLGANPYAQGRGVARMEEIAASAGQRSDPFGESWFVNQRESGLNGLEALGLKGATEVQFALLSFLNKKHNELLDAAYNAQVHTFGWQVIEFVDSVPKSATGKVLKKDLRK